MSVINSMLRDLDRRRVEVGGEGPYQHVRVIAPAHRWQRGALFALGFVVLAAAAGGFAYQHWTASESIASTNMRSASSSGQSPPAPLVKPVGMVSESESGLSLAVSRQLQASSTTTSPQTAIAQVATTAPVPAPPPAAAMPAAPIAASAPAVAVQPAPSPQAVVVAKGAAASLEDKGTALRPGERATVARPETATPAALRDAPPAAPATAAPAPAKTANPSSEPVKQVSANQRADNEYRLASELFNQGQMTQAIEGFSRALAADPRHDAARQSLVGVLLNAKRAAEAERILTERLAMAPDHAGFATILARLQAERGDADGALATLGATLPWATGNAPYHATMAALHARLGQHGQAITHYQAALRLAPNAGVWWMGLGLSFQAAGRNAEAVEALQRARTGENISADLVAYVELKIRQLQ